MITDKKMKIVITTMLLAIMIFLHFGEISTMENKESSSGSLRKRGRPPGRNSKRDESGRVYGKFRLSPYHRKPVNLERDPDEYIEHMGQRIQVWLYHDTIVQAKYPNNNCPTGTAHGKLNYLLRMVTLAGNKRLVECLDKHGNLLGVRPWAYTPANIMEPNSGQWFFVYSGKIFRVRVNPDTGSVINITLAENDENEVAEGEKCEEFDMAGFKFIVIRGNDGEITGAEPLQRTPAPTVVHSFRDLIS